MGNYGIVLSMGNAGFISYTVGLKKAYSEWAESSALDP